MWCLISSLEAEAQLTASHLKLFLKFSSVTENHSLFWTFYSSEQAEQVYCIIWGADENTWKHTNTAGVCCKQRPSRAKAIQGLRKFTVMFNKKTDFKSEDTNWVHLSNFSIWLLIWIVLIALYSQVSLKCALYLCVK